MARQPRSRALWSDASPLIKRRVQAAVPQLHLVSTGLTRKLEPSARIPRFHTPVEAVTPPGDCRRERDTARRPETDHLQDTHRVLATLAADAPTRLQIQQFEE